MFLRVNIPLSFLHSHSKPLIKMLKVQGVLILNDFHKLNVKIIVTTNRKGLAALCLEGLPEQSLSSV